MVKVLMIKLPEAFSIIALISTLTTIASLIYADNSYLLNNDLDVGDRLSSNIAVAVSGNPLLVYIVEAIGGEYVEVIYIYPPGVDIHDYEPSPRDLQRIGKADLVILDGWNHTPANILIWRSFSGSKDIIDLYKVSILSGWEPYRFRGVDIVDEFLYDPLAFNASVKAIALHLSRIAEDKGLDKAPEFFIASSNTLIEVYSDIVRISRELVYGSSVALASPITLYLSKAVGLEISSILAIGEDFEPTTIDIDEIYPCVVGSIYDSRDLFALLRDLGSRTVVIDFTEPLIAPLKLAYGVAYTCLQQDSEAVYVDDNYFDIDPTYVYAVLAYSIIITALLVVKSIGDQFGRPSIKQG